jgi:Mg2+ and Co2+ transporter CorA
VQSVTKAQKSRLLNKYILVFTIITIIFLPPMFVSVGNCPGKCPETYY